PLSRVGTYNWHTVDGISTGDTVQIDIDSQEGADPAFQVYPWTDLDADDEVDYETELGGILLNVDDGTTGGAETGSFVAAEDMSIAILVFNFAYVYFPGNHYTLEVDTRVSSDVNGQAGSLWFTQKDTYEFERNITFSLILTCWTETDIVWEIQLLNVRFENFFAPTISITSVDDLGDYQFNVTWTAADSNADDDLYYVVYLSSDGGTTFQILQQNLTATFFVWDSDGWLIDNYMFRIRVYDNDGVYPRGTPDDPPLSYWPGLYSQDVSSAFGAGNVLPPEPTTETTTTTTTTTTETEPTPTPIDPLLIGLLGGIGVGVVVLLILFLIRKR
ncbi:MAG: hypothetical protein ACFFEE_12945, partial [Candidatus Thorarchaeota archaeon]